MPASITVEPAYGRVRIILHWLSAIVILWALATGFSASFFSKHSPFRTAIDAINPQAATLLIPFFVWRLGLYLAAKPWAGWAEAGLQARCASFAHAALYAVITLVLVSGVVMMPEPWMFLGLMPMPVLLHTPAALAAAFQFHEVSCLLLLMLVGLHLAAVAWHLCQGHAVLRRMMPAA